MTCSYCTDYSNVKQTIICPYEDVYNNLLGAVYIHTSNVVPNYFVIKLPNIISAYFYEILLFDINCDNYELSAYYGQDIKKETYKRVMTDISSMVSSTTSAQKFYMEYPPFNCLYAHGVELRT